MALPSSFLNGPEARCTHFHHSTRWVPVCDDVSGVVVLFRCLFAVVGRHLGRAKFFFFSKGSGGQRRAVQSSQRRGSLKRRGRVHLCARVRDACSDCLCMHGECPMMARSQRCSPACLFKPAKARRQWRSLQCTPHQTTNNVLCSLGRSLTPVHSIRRTLAADGSERRPSVAPG
jgi:hypothetical protein